MTNLHPLPLDSSELDGIRLRARKRFVTSGMGAILRRKMGQSLEYREHRSYSIGDDVRHIDWRASARHGGDQDFLVRSFEAEEQFSLLLVIDTGATMRSGLDDPERVSKLEIAFWVAQALSYIASREKIKVALSPLDGNGALGRPRYVQGAQISQSVSQFVRDVLEQEPFAHEDQVNIVPTLNALAQSSVTLFLTDLYVEQDLDFVSAVKQASRGYRQAIVCELNSWPCERALLERNIVELEGVGTHAAPQGAFEADGAELAKAEAAIQRHRGAILDDLHTGGVVHIPWDLPQDPTPFAISSGFQAWFDWFILRCELFGRSS